MASCGAPHSAAPNEADCHIACRNAGVHAHMHGVKQALRLLPVVAGKGTHRVESTDMSRLAE